MVRTVVPPTPVGLINKVVLAATVPVSETVHVPDVCTGAMEPRRVPPLMVSPAPSDVTEDVSIIVVVVRVNVRLAPPVSAIVPALHVRSGKDMEPPAKLPNAAHKNNSWL